MQRYACMVRTSGVVYLKFCGVDGVNTSTRGVNTDQSQDPARKTGRDITLNNPETKGTPLVKTFY